MHYAYNFCYRHIVVYLHTVSRCTFPVIPGDDIIMSHYVRKVAVHNICIQTFNVVYWESKYYVTTWCTTTYSSIVYESITYLVRRYIFTSARVQYLSYVNISGVLYITHNKNRFVKCTQTFVILCVRKFFRKVYPNPGVGCHLNFVKVSTHHNRGKMKRCLFPGF